MINFSISILGLGLGLMLNQAVAQNSSDDDVQKLVCTAFTSGHVGAVENFSKSRMDGVDKLYQGLHEYRCPPDGRTPAYILYAENNPIIFDKYISPRLEEMDYESKLILLNTPATNYRNRIFGDKHTLLDRVESDALLILNSDYHNEADKYLKLRDILISHGAKTSAQFNQKTSSITTRLEDKIITGPSITRGASGYRLSEPINTVRGISISGNGKYAFITDASNFHGNNTNHLYRLNLATKRMVTILKLNGDNRDERIHVTPIAVASSIDGSNAAVAMYMDNVLVIDALNKTVINKIVNENSHPASVKITPDNRNVIVGYTDCSVQQYDLRSGVKNKTYRRPGCPVNPNPTPLSGEWAITPEIVIDPHENYLLIGIPYQSLRLIDLQTGQRLSNLDISGGKDSIIKGETIRIESLELIQNAQTIAMLSPYNRKVLFIDVSSSELVDSVKLPERPRSIEFFDSGSYFLVGTDDNSMTLWDRYEHEVVHLFQIDRLNIREIAIDEVNDRILSSNGSNRLLSWDLPCHIPVCKQKSTE